MVVGVDVLVVVYMEITMEILSSDAIRWIVA